MTPENTKWLIFSDIDGTFLDVQTYSFAPALPALELVKKRQIALIFVTSKTAREVQALQQRIDYHHPFVVENGSAVFIPRNYFPRRDPQWIQQDAYYLKILGKRYEQILSFFKQLKDYCAQPLKGFSEMSVEQIKQLTGLDEQQSRVARERSFSEPFIALHEGFDFARAERFCRQHGYRLLKGNRFFHLLGNADKGQAVRYVRDLYQAMNGQRYFTLGLGDSPNDRQLLENTDHGVVVRGPDGRYGLRFEGKEIYYTRESGPAGWNEAIVKFFKE